MVRYDELPEYSEELVAAVQAAEFPWPDQYGHPGILDLDEGTWTLVVRPDDDEGVPEERWTEWFESVPFLNQRFTQDGDETEEEFLFAVMEAWRETLKPEYQSEVHLDRAGDVLNEYRETRGEDPLSGLVAASGGGTSEDDTEGGGGRPGVKTTEQSNYEQYPTDRVADLFGVEPVREIDDIVRRLELTQRKKSEAGEGMRTLTLGEAREVARDEYTFRSAFQYIVRNETSDSITGIVLRQLREDNLICDLSDEEFAQVSELVGRDINRARLFAMRADNCDDQRAKRQLDTWVYGDDGADPETVEAMGWVGLYEQQNDDTARKILKAIGRFDEVADEEKQARGAEALEQIGGSTDQTDDEPEPEPEPEPESEPEPDESEPDEPDTDEVWTPDDEGKVTGECPNGHTLRVVEVDVENGYVTARCDNGEFEVDYPRETEPAADDATTEEAERDLAALDPPETVAGWERHPQDDEREASVTWWKVSTSDDPDVWREDVQVWQAVSGKWQATTHDLERNPLYEYGKAADTTYLVDDAESPAPALEAAIEHMEDNPADPDADPEAADRPDMEMVAGRGRRLAELGLFSQDVLDALADRGIETDGELAVAYLGEMGSDLVDIHGLAERSINSAIRGAEIPPEALGLDEDWQVYLMRLFRFFGPPKGITKNWASREARFEPATAKAYQARIEESPRLGTPPSEFDWTAIATGDVKFTTDMNTIAFDNVPGAKDPIAELRDDFSGWERPKMVVEVPEEEAYAVVHPNGEWTAVLKSWATRIANWYGSGSFDPETVEMEVADSGLEAVIVGGGELAVAPRRSSREEFAEHVEDAIAAAESGEGQADLTAAAEQAAEEVGTRDDDTDTDDEDAGEELPESETKVLFTRDGGTYTLAVSRPDVPDDALERLAKMVVREWGTDYLRELEDVDERVYLVATVAYGDGVPTGYISKVDPPEPAGTNLIAPSQYDMTDLLGDEAPPVGNNRWGAVTEMREYVDGGYTADAVKRLVAIHGPNVVTLAENIRADPSIVEEIDGLGPAAADEFEEWARDPVAVYEAAFEAFDVRREVQVEKLDGDGEMFTPHPDEDTGEERLTVREADWRDGDTDMEDSDSDADEPAESDPEPPEVDIPAPTEVDWRDVSGTTDLTDLYYVGDSTAADLREEGVNSAEQFLVAFLTTKGSDLGHILGRNYGKAVGGLDLSLIEPADVGLSEPWQLRFMHFLRYHGTPWSEIIAGDEPDYPYEGTKTTSTHPQNVAVGYQFLAPQDVNWEAARGGIPNAANSIQVGFDARQMRDGDRFEFIRPGEVTEYAFVDTDTKAVGVDRDDADWVLLISDAETFSLVTIDALEHIEVALGSDPLSDAEHRDEITVDAGSSNRPVLFEDPETGLQAFVAPVITDSAEWDETIGEYMAEAVGVNPFEERPEIGSSADPNVLGDRMADLLDAEGWRDVLDRFSQKQVKAVREGIRKDNVGEAVLKKLVEAVADHAGEDWRYKDSAGHSLTVREAEKLVSQLGFDADDYEDGTLTRSDGFPKRRQVTDLFDGGGYTSGPLRMYGAHSNVADADLMEIIYRPTDGGWELVRRDIAERPGEEEPDVLTAVQVQFREDLTRPSNDDMHRFLRAYIMEEDIAEVELTPAEQYAADALPTWNEEYGEEALRPTPAYSPGDTYPSDGTQVAVGVATDVGGWGWRFSPEAIPGSLQAEIKTPVRNRWLDSKLEEWADETDGVYWLGYVTVEDGGVGEYSDDTTETLTLVGRRPWEAKYRDVVEDLDDDDLIQLANLVANELARGDISDSIFLEDMVKEMTRWADRHSDLVETGWAYQIGTRRITGEEIESPEQAKMLLAYVHDEYPEAIETAREKQQEQAEAERERQKREREREERNAELWNDPPEEVNGWTLVPEDGWVHYRGYDSSGSSADYVHIYVGERKDYPSAVTVRDEEWPDDTDDLDPDDLLPNLFIGGTPDTNEEAMGAAVEWMEDHPGYGPESAPDADADADERADDAEERAEMYLSELGVRSKQLDLLRDLAGSLVEALDYSQADLLNISGIGEKTVERVRTLAAMWNGVKVASWDFEKEDDDALVWTSGDVELRLEKDRWDKWNLRLTGFELPDWHGEKFPLDGGWGDSSRPLAAQGVRTFLSEFPDGFDPSTDEIPRTVFRAAGDSTMVGLLDEGESIRIAAVGEKIEARRGREADEQKEAEESDDTEPAPEPRPVRDDLQPAVTVHRDDTEDLGDVTETIAFVGCGKAKKDGTHPAKDLYTSTYFDLKRRYAEAVADRWYILSAEYGLVDPDDEIASYDRTMDDVNSEDWADGVAEDLPDLSRARAVMLAGKDYLTPIRGIVEDRAPVVVYPFEKRGLFEQMEFLREQLDSGRPEAIPIDRAEATPDAEPESEPEPSTEETPEEADRPPRAGERAATSSGEIPDWVPREGDETNGWRWVSSDLLATEGGVAQIRTYADKETPGDTVHRVSVTEMNGEYVVTYENEMVADVLTIDPYVRYGSLEEALTEVYDYTQKHPGDGVGPEPLGKHAKNGDQRFREVEDEWIVSEVRRRSLDEADIPEESADEQPDPADVEESTERTTDEPNRRARRTEPAPVDEDAVGLPPNWVKQSDLPNLVVYERTAEGNGEVLLHRSRDTWSVIAVVSDPRQGQDYERTVAKRITSKREAQQTAIRFMKGKTPVTYESDYFGTSGEIDDTYVESFVARVRSDMEPTNSD